MSTRQNLSLFSFYLLLIFINFRLKASPINKYEFPTETSFSRDSVYLSEGTTPFFSLPFTFKNYDISPYLTFRNRDKKLSIDNFAIGGAQVKKNEALFQAIAGGRFLYNSEKMDGFVDIRANTINEFEDKYYISEVETERYISGSEHISGFSDYDFLLKEAWLEFKLNESRLAIGKKKIRWGPGYKGTLGMSGTAHEPYSLYQFCIPFGDRFRYSAFFNGFDDFNREEDPRFGAGQRVDVRIGDKIDIGLYQLVDFHGVKDIAQFIVPLQLYYAGSNLGTNKRENLLGGCDINVYLKPFRIYGEFINDDITMFDDKGNPDKWAYQLGTAWYSMKMVREIGFEYTHLSQYIYGHDNRMNRHTYWDESLAWPWGNHQDVFNLHALFKFNDKLDAVSEISYWHLGNGRITDSWVEQGRPNKDHVAYFAQNAEYLLSFLLKTSYRPFSWMETEIYINPAWKGGKSRHSAHVFLKLSVPEDLKNISVE